VVRTIWRWIQKDTSSTDWLIVLLTGVIAVTAYLQWRAISGQLTEMKKATRATREATYATCKSTEIARRTLIEIQSGGSDTHNAATSAITQAVAATRSQAAEIEVERQNISGFSPGGHAASKVGIRNTGKSAALAIHIIAESKIMKRGKEPKEFIYSKPSHDTYNTGSLYPTDPPGEFPIAVWENGQARSLSAPDIAEFEAGNWYLLTYGRITYRDIFGGHHWATFCSFAERDPPPLQPVHHSKCAAYNHIDEIPLPNPVVSKSQDQMPEIVCKPPENSSN